MTNKFIIQINFYLQYKVVLLLFNKIPLRPQFHLSIYSKLIFNHLLFRPVYLNKPATAILCTVYLIETYMY